MKVKKLKRPHLVPLSHQAVGILRELQPLAGGGHYVFPGARTATRPMSENTINAALRRLGFSGEEICGHGFRAMARTILDEALGVRPDFIEHQLAHAVRDPNGRAYNRTVFLPERCEMMQRWAGYLDELSGRTDAQRGIYHPDSDASQLSGSRTHVQAQDNPASLTDHTRMPV